MSFEEKISIVVTSDNHYAVMIAALIKSIEVHHKSKELIDFIIIDDGISKRNKLKLQKSINPDIITIRWVKSTNVIPKDVKIPSDQSTLPHTIYMRLFAPNLVDENCTKLIYMDVDMILYDDISKLYNINIENNIIGAVQDYILTVDHLKGIPNYEDLGILPQSKYFNAGLLLINPKKWIEFDVGNKVIKCLTNNKQHAVYSDQYGLNVVLYKQWLEIDRTWNCGPLFDFDKPKLIHFLDIKPIFESYFSNPNYQKEFFRLLSLTEFKNFKPISNFNRLFKKARTIAFKKLYNMLSKQII